MAEFYSFDEAGMRKLATAFHAQKNEISNLRRHLAHVATRRHEAVYMPGSKQVKILRHPWLVPAYGGSTTTGISGSAAVTNGNTSPSNRQIFPKLWENAYTINSSGDLEADTNTGYCVNLGSLPISANWSLAVKLPEPHPVFGDLWAILKDNPAHYGAAHYTYLTEESAGDWTLTDSEAILLRAGTGSAVGTGTKQNWVFPYGGDVMLSHMGKWEVTFGFAGYVAGDFTYFQLNTGSSSGHTHTYDLPAGFIVQFGVHRNFESGTSVVGTNPDTSHEMRTWIEASNSQVGSANYRTTHEKTVYVESDTSPWHGQHHTRLSLYCKVTHVGTSAGTPTFIITNAWMSVRPARGDGDSSLSDRLGAGANQYPGGWNDGAGTFVWYGGGSEPDFLDKDGGVI